MFLEKTESTGEISWFDHFKDELTTFNIKINGTGKFNPAAVPAYGI